MRLALEIVIPYWDPDLEAFERGAIAHYRSHSTTEGRPLFDTAGIGSVEAAAAAAVAAATATDDELLAAWQATVVLEQRKYATSLLVHSRTLNGVRDNVERIW